MFSYACREVDSAWRHGDAVSKTGEVHADLNLWSLIGGSRVVTAFLACAKVLAVSLFSYLLSLRLE